VLLVSSNVELPVLPEARMEIRNEMRLPSAPQNQETLWILAERTGEIKGKRSHGDTKSRRKGKEAGRQGNRDAGKKLPSLRGSGQGDAENAEKSERR
jgi:hypothetical protein